MNEQYKMLAEAYTLPSDVELKNRMVMAPMTNFSSNADGTVTDEEVNYYARRSRGVGAVVTACAYVTPDGKGFPGQIAADRDELIPSLKSLADGIKGQGAKAILQIFHGGRMCPPELVPDGDIVSASNVPAERGPAKGIEPKTLKSEEIEDILDAFGDATIRAIRAGFDGVEIHGANGYLIQQFFSPHSNIRDDQFGGELENRMNFPLGIIEKVHDVIEQFAKEPFIVGYRFSPEEPETPGIFMNDTLEFVDVLADQGLDYLHVSLENFWSKPQRGVKTDESRIELLLEKINDRLPLIGVGSIYSAEDARQAFSTGIPLLALGRELIMDPDWMEKIETGREDEIITTLDKDKQDELVVPDPLWNRITAIPGWFPGIK